MSHNKKTKLLSSMADLIEDLLDAGVDEDEHFRSNSFDELRQKDITSICQDIDQVDELMSLVRPIIIKTLLKVNKDYNEKI